MPKFTDNINVILTLFYKVAEIAMLFVGLVVLVYILLGKDAGPYAISVVANISLFIGAIGTQTLVALALVFVGYSYFTSKKKK